MPNKSHPMSIPENGNEYEQSALKSVLEMKERTSENAQGAIKLAVGGKGFVHFTCFDRYLFYCQRNK